MMLRRPSAAAEVIDSISIAAIVDGLLVVPRRNWT
jgi:hypothetical protein